MNLLWLPLVLAAAVVADAAGADEGKDESGKGKERYENKDRRSDDSGRREDRHRHERGSHYFERHGYTRLDIPEGHKPPPGECRLWYPDRPPGQQPPPFKCGSAAPTGAWVLQRPVRAPQQIEAVVYDQRRPGVVVSIGIFDAKTGSFIRINGSR
jgi:hypothetical protein